MAAAKAIKTALPRVTLAWAIEEPIAELVAGAPFVDEVFTTRTKSWRRSLANLETLREIGSFLNAARAFAPDVIVDAQGLFKSAWATFLIPAGRKVGFDFRSATEGINSLVTDERVDARARTHVTDRALALAEHVTSAGPFERTADVRHLVERPDREVDTWLAERVDVPFALLQPFSSADSKEWSAPEVVAFARKTAEIGLCSVVRWGPGERERAERIVLESGGAARLAPRTGPAATARLASRARLFVGADTGPTHLAAATGTPTLALFGPTDPARFGPIGPRTSTLRFPGAVYNRTGPADAQNFSEDVFQTALQLLSRAPSKPTS
jgi:heptosyltransferase-1